jgi:mannan endo-1,6-alpha-mannosidase
MSHYKGNQSGEYPGLLDGRYFWYNSAVLWSTMIDYWRYTGDDTYNVVTVEGLAAQNGNDSPGGQPFLPFNWTLNIGNDDQGFWAMAAMQAAELGFPAAPQGQPSWIELAQDVFDLQAARWSLEEQGTCKGGLVYGINSPSSADKAFKSTLSSAVFLNLGARLSRYTGNQTYAEWAEKTWTWLATTGLIDDESNVFEATGAQSNCTRINRQQWSHAAGVVLEAAAYMYNHVGISLSLTPPVPLTPTSLPTAPSITSN